VRIRPTRDGGTTVVELSGARVNPEAAGASPGS
jgi:hypothetical protein